jgi:hypothetical protein
MCGACDGRFPERLPSGGRFVRAPGRQFIVAAWTHSLEIAYHFAQRVSTKRHLAASGVLTTVGRMTNDGGTRSADGTFVL